MYKLRAYQICCDYLFKIYVFIITYYHVQYFLPEGPAGVKM